MGVLFNNESELNVKRKTRESVQLQVAQKQIEDKDCYYAEIERINSQTFIDEQVNTYIDSVYV